MESLEKRLADLKVKHEKEIALEYFKEEVYNILLPYLPADATLNLTALSRTWVFVYISLSPLSKFEDFVMEDLTKDFNLKWERKIDSGEVEYSTKSSLKLTEAKIYISVKSKPDNNCRITPIFTGKKIKKAHWVEIEEDEVEYLVDCSEAKEVAAVPPDSSELIDPKDSLGDLL